MSYETITLLTPYTTRGGVIWPPDTELELEQRLRQGWQIGYKTPDGRIGTASIPHGELPPEVSVVIGSC